MNWIRLMFLAVLVVLFLSACEKAVPKKNIVARVGEETLSLDEIMADIPPQVRPNITSFEIRQYVLRWVNNQVLYQEALKRKLHEGQDLQNEFTKLKIELLVNRLIERTLDNDISVSDEEIEAYFENNKEQFAFLEDKVRAYHYCAKSRQEANSVRTRLRRGEAFHEVVSTIADDSSSIDWDLGYFSKQEIIPEISNVVFSLRPGNYSQPIQSSYGYHVVQLVDKKSKGDIMDLQMVREEIRLKLQEKKKQEDYQRFLQQVKNDFVISTDFRLLDTVVLDSLVREGD